MAAKISAMKINNIRGSIKRKSAAHQQAYQHGENESGEESKIIKQTNQ